ncbi:hypothetical protein ACQYEI_001289 [Enterobacter hormaechei]
MENFKGTKGNWSYSKETGTIRGDGGLLAELLINGSEDDNGTLMSAAPDLLDALQCLFDNYKQLADSGDAGNWRLEDEPAGKKALHAINKALGKE